MKRIFVLSAFLFGIAACKKDGGTTGTNSSPCNNGDPMRCQLTGFSPYVTGITYDSLGRVTGPGNFKLRYAPNKIMAYLPDNNYVDVRLNAAGRINEYYYGTYNPTDSSVVGALTLSQYLIFDAAGNLTKIYNGGWGSAISVTPEGSNQSISLIPGSDRYEYDANGNMTKHYRYYYDGDTFQGWGELLMEDYPAYDGRFNPNYNESLRLWLILNNYTNQATAGPNNPTKINYHYTANIYGISARAHTETVTNTYNENCFLTTSHFLNEDGYQTADTFSYNCH